MTTHLRYATKPLSLQKIDIALMTLKLGLQPGSGPSLPGEQSFNLSLEVIPLAGQRARRLGGRMNGRLSLLPAFQRGVIDLPLWNAHGRQDGLLGNPLSPDFFCVALLAIRGKTSPILTERINDCMV